jgi:hypothetical protein
MIENSDSLPRSKSVILGRSILMYYNSNTNLCWSIFISLQQLQEKACQLSQRDPFATKCDRSIAPSYTRNRECVRILGANNFRLKGCKLLVSSILRYMTAKRISPEQAAANIDTEIASFLSSDNP